MTPERWQQIETLYHAALQRAPEARAEFLAVACANDVPLQHEVEKLLAMNDAAGSFLAAPAMQLEGAFPTMETQLGHYQILGQLGAGGMGVVYRARDTRLNRDVAIKVLPADFARDAERLHRFELEAKATGSLNHPNILTIYDIGTHDGSLYLVAELLEGEELRAQLNHGALPMKRAIDYAQQIAAGLTAAHAKGIVHRDLKPENLFVTKDGRIKILDFGLAKMAEKGRKGEGEKGRLGEDDATLALPPPLPHSPSPLLTAPGTVMGTVAYMSPEQVRGEAVDARSDLFSFGMILYEMLAGKRAFDGATMADLMSAILREEPPELSATNPQINPQLEKIVQRCLEKKAEARFQTASDLGFALSTLTTASGSRPEAQLNTATALPALTESLPVGKAGLFGNARLAWIAATVAGLALLAALPIVIAHLRHASPTAATPVRFTLAAPEKVTQLNGPQLSPDGRTLVFSAQSEGQNRLWVRPLDSLTAQPLAGSEGLSSLSSLHFWSADSRAICFPTSDNKLKRLDLAGGAPQTLCTLPGSIPGTSGGGAWNREGVILFTADRNIWRVSATGGEPTLVLGTTEPKREARFSWPSFLPDGRHFLYCRTRQPQGEIEIYLASLDSQETTRLLAADSHAIYTTAATGDGYLLFSRGGSLVAQPFEADALKLTGEPFVVAERVGVAGTGRGLFSASDHGNLIYNSVRNFDNQQLLLVDRAGKPVEPVGAPGQFEAPKLSPDGKRVAVVRTEAQTRTEDIYVIDLARGVSSRLTHDPGSDRFPVWSPDGNRIAWQVNRDGVFLLYQKLASGIGTEELLFKSANRIIPSNWSPDGRFLGFSQLDPKTRDDLWVLPLEGERQPFLFLQTPFSEAQSRFSPDGRWIVYVSDDQGRDEVYVQTFPASTGKWQISKNGGISPQWRGDGKELFYRSADNKLMAVEVKAGSSFEVSAPKALFDLTPLKLKDTPFTVTATGDRFLFVTQEQEAANLQYTVVVNWAAEAKK